MDFFPNAQKFKRITVSHPISYKKVAIFCEFLFLLEQLLPKVYFSILRFSLTLIMY